MQPPPPPPPQPALLLFVAAVVAALLTLLEWVSFLDSASLRLCADINDCDRDIFAVDAADDRDRVDGERGDDDPPIAPMAFLMATDDVVDPPL